MPATLAGLSEGDALFIPATWVKERRNDLEGRVGQLADELTDLVSSLYPNSANLPADKYEILVETLAGWWRSSNPNKIPTKGELDKFGSSLLQWYEAIGKYLTPDVARKIAWAQVPWAFIAGLAKENFPWWAVDANKVNDLLKSRVVPGTAKHLPGIKSWENSVWDKNQLAQQNLDESALWVALTKFRWDLFPDGSIDPSSFKFGMDPQKWLISQIEIVYPYANMDAIEQNQDLIFPGGIDLISCGTGKVKIGGQCYSITTPGIDGNCGAGSVFHAGMCIASPCGAGETASVDPSKGIICTKSGGGSGAPQTCPPGAISVGGSCDCKPLGPRYVYDPLDNACVDCGPNSNYNATTMTCYCDPGYVFAGPEEGAGCIKQGGDTPGPVTTCGPGTKLVGGQCVPEEKTSEKKEESKAPLVIAGVGILLGLAAVAYRLRRK